MPAARSDSAVSEPAPFAPFARLASERLYDSPWCALRRDRVALPDGSAQDYHVFELCAAIVVVPELADGSLALLWQYRYPHGRTHWEVPAGRMQADEQPEQAAVRELREEAGLECARLERLPGFYPINGISDHYAHAFVARGCVRAGEPAPEPAEQLLVRTLAREDVRALWLSGAFADGFSALALAYYFAGASSSSTGTASAPGSPSR